MSTSKKGLARRIAAIMGAILMLVVAAAPSSAQPADAKDSGRAIIIYPNIFCNIEIGVWGATHGLGDTMSPIKQGFVWVMTRCPDWLKQMPGQVEARHYPGALCLPATDPFRWYNRVYAKRGVHVDEVGKMGCDYTDPTLAEWFNLLKGTGNRTYATQIVDRLNNATYPLPYAGKTPWEQENKRDEANPTGTPAGEPTTVPASQTITAAEEEAALAYLNEKLRKDANPSDDAVPESGNTPDPQLTQVDGGWAVPATLSTPEEASKMSGRPVSYTEMVPNSWHKQAVSQNTERGVENCASWVEVWQWNGRDASAPAGAPGTAGSPAPASGSAPATTTNPGQKTHKEPPNTTPLGNNKYEVAITQCPKKGPKHRTLISCARKNFTYPDLDPNVGTGKSPAIHESYTGPWAKGSDKSWSACNTWSRYTNHYSLENGQQDISALAAN